MSQQLTIKQLQKIEEIRNESYIKSVDHGFYQRENVLYLSLIQRIGLVHLQLTKMECMSLT
jgi:hypothetical protein